MRIIITKEIMGEIIDEIKSAKIKNPEKRIGEIISDVFYKHIDLKYGINHVSNLPYDKNPFFNDDLIDDFIIKIINMSELDMGVSRLWNNFDYNNIL